MRWTCWGLGLLLAVAPGCQRPPDRLRVALSSAPLSLDPHVTNEWASFAVNANVYQSLVRTDPALRLAPSLAERWLNPDDLTWEFVIASDARFHDGAPVTAADVAASLRRARESEWRGALVGVSRAEASGERRVVVHTSRPFPTLLRNLLGIAVVPRGAADLDQRPVGSGPYRVAGREGGRVRLLRVSASAPPAVREAVFEAIPDPAARVRAIASGAVDLATDVPPDAVEALRRVAGVQVLEAPGLRQVFLGFDLARPRSPHVDAPRNPFLDRRVRRAVAAAIDRAHLVGVVLGGRGEVATQMVPRTAFGFDPGRPAPAYDPARARALLAEAGYPGGFTVTLDSPSGVYLADQALATYVAEALAEVGIRVRQNRLDKRRFFETLYARDTSFFLMTWNCLSNDSQEVLDFLLHSPDPGRGYGSENAGGYASPYLDRLIEAAGQQMDPAQRLELLRQAEMLALDEVAYVPLATPFTMHALRQPFRWTPRPDRRIALDEITIAR